MRRKAGAGRPPPEIGQLSAGRALRDGVVQAAEEAAGLAAIAGQVAEDRASLARIVGELPQAPLIGLVEGDGGRFGLVVLDAQLVAALIEIQTTGRVAARPAEPRAPTRTDAIMCADFIDRALEMFEVRAAAGGLAEAPALTGFRYALALAEPRAIPLTLEEGRYRRFALPLDLAGGAKAGTFLVILPERAPGRAGGAPAGDGGPFTEALRATVLQSEAELAAILARRRMPLAEVTRLAVGSVIALPRAALDRVAVEDLSGRVVARARLGQADGHRALRLHAPGDSADPAPARPAPPEPLPPPAPAPEEAALPDLPGDMADFPDLAALSP
ncbi:flagellar switch protein FliM [Sinisalibacter aestuarii]|uniref:Flagellar switch protein FliM n=2 Tax=Sinisalibacter aestuarii TaxID=2949426 RepID=A0ABQ5LXH6_9RHOB|nr:flagellar switch protein FliM [Sinisalibacter aestuarii]